MIAFLMLSVFAKGQFANYGTDPSHIRWKVIKTAHFKLIYPNTNDSMAFRYALFLEKAYPQMGKTIGRSSLRAFPVVLHPENMASNGVVVWAPRRMELMTTPSATLPAQSWDKHLTLHELRHVLQMRKLSQGIFKPFEYLAGEQTAGLSTFAVPKWFLEGDAVAAETALSNSGRGRLPEFHLSYRTQRLSGDFFSYDKWAFGSYRHYTGDYYALGYNMTAFARHQYGADCWDKVTHRFSRRFFKIPPFSKALRHYTGVKPETLFKNTFDFLQEEWLQQEEAYQDEGFGQAVDYLLPPARRYTSYKYPQTLNNGSSVIALKTGLDEIPSLVMITGGKEERLCYIGSVNSPVIRNNHRIYWTENVSGRRWTHESYSELKYYDLTTRKIVTVTPKERFLAPALRQDGRIAAVSQPASDGANRVILIDVEEKRRVHSFDTPDNCFVKELAFADEQTLAAIAVHDAGLSLLLLDLRSGLWTEILGPTSANIASLTAQEDRLYFESGLDGTNNIYCFELSTRTGYRLTTARFGAFTPALSNDGKRLLFADYQVSGHRIASVAVDRLDKHPANFRAPYSFALAESLAQQEAFNLDTDTFSLNSAVSGSFRPRPYRKAAHLFRVHSWAPFYYDASDMIRTLADDLSAVVKPGVMLMSQNLLSTLTSQAGWFYDNGYHHGKLSLAYTGCFPALYFSLEYGGKAFEYNWEKDKEGEDRLTFHDTGRRLVAMDASVYVPLNLSRDHFISGFRPSVTFSYTNNRYQQHGRQRFSPYGYLLSELRYYRYRKLAQRDLLPRFGYQLRLQMLNIPSDTKNFGSLYAAGLTTYWPGLVRGHGLMLRLSYQYQHLDGKSLYLPQKLIQQPRGFYYLYQTRQKVELKADYALPLFCPDWSIGGLAYLKRLRSNLFYDLSENQTHQGANWTAQSAFGADFIFDCHLFRLSQPLSLGLRFIQPVNEGSLQTEALFSVSF
jgi:hypothetical protein